MKSAFAAAVTALVALSAQARADGVPTPYGLTLTPQAYNWSGFYVGLNGGWAGINTGWTWETPTGGNGLCSFSDCTGITNTSHRQNEGILGGQIGLQQQFGVFVLGVEAAVDETLNGEDNGASGSCVGFTATPNMQCRTSFSELVTVGGRLGWTPASLWLLYASGGFATAEVESKLRAINTAGGI
jgi:outer membrane immunogenic protein